jgi:hypothetical protein
MTGGQQFQTPAGMRPSERKVYEKSRAEALGKRSVTEQQRQEETGRTTAPLIEDIDRAMNTIEKSPNMTTGLIGRATGAIMPSSAAGTTADLLKGIRNRISIAQINQMRQLSPTGAALGNVSDKDAARLESMLGQLEQTSDPKELLFNLDRVKRYYHELVNPGAAPLSPRYSAPSTQAPGGDRPSGRGTDKRTIGGKSYTKIGGQWYED